MKIENLRTKISKWRRSNIILADILKQQDEEAHVQSMSLWFWQKWAVIADVDSFPAELRASVEREADVGFEVAFGEEDCWRRNLDTGTFSPLLMSPRHSSEDAGHSSEDAGQSPEDA